MLTYPVVNEWNAEADEEARFPPDQEKLIKFELPKKRQKLIEDGAHIACNLWYWKMMKEEGLQCGKISEAQVSVYT